MNAPSVEGPPDDPWSSMMKAAIAGDESVYRRLLEDIGRSVRAMARAAFGRARLGDADVEDAVQETLLAIHLKRHTWDPSQKLGPWVNAIARHKIIDAMRRRGARRAEPIEDFEEFLAAPAEEDPHALSDAKRLMEALSAAPARHRPVDLARRAVDRGDRGAPVDDRGRGPGRAAPGAEIARRRLAEVRVVKTSEFIAALAADPVPESVHMGRRFAAALALGAPRRARALRSSSSGRGRTSPRLSGPCASISSSSTRSRSPCRRSCCSSASRAPTRGPARWRSGFSRR